MPKDISMGSGLAQGAGDTIRLRQEYTKYRIDAITSGDQVLSFQEWMSRVKGISPPVNTPT